MTDTEILELVGKRLTAQDRDPHADGELLERIVNSDEFRTKHSELFKRIMNEYW